MRKLSVEKFENLSAEEISELSAEELRKYIKLKMVLLIDPIELDKLPNLVMM